MLDLVIVGGGPAGIGAGIQAQHMGLDIRILEKESWGGRLSLARRVENFPGLPDPLTGPQVVEALVTQASNQRLPMVKDSSESIDYRQDRFVVLGRLDEYRSRSVIVATGVKPRRLSVPGIGVACDRLFHTWHELPAIREKRIAVVGGGEAAFDQACSLAERGAEVTVFIRGHAARAFHGLVLEAKALGVDVRLQTSITWASPEGGGLSLRLSDPAGSTLSVHYVLASVWVVPSSVTMTNTAAERMDRGLYFSGDVCSQDYRQAAIAFGDGIKKAMIVYEYVKG